MNPDNESYVSQGVTTHMRKCFVCNKEVDENTGIKKPIRDTLHVVAHQICYDALTSLISIESQMTTTTDDLQRIIREVEGFPVLVSRCFSHNSHFILAYFAYYRESPRYVSELSDWLNSSGLKVSNPSDAVRKLTMAGKLARVPDEKGKLRYIITDSGHRELLQLLQEAN